MSRFRKWWLWYPYRIHTLSYNEWGRPNLPYVFFRYDGNAWQCISLEQFPAEFKTLNVTIPFGWHAVEEMSSSSLVSAKKIEASNRGLTQPEYRTILRELLAQERTKRMCAELVSNGKDTWLGIDWFRDEKNPSACVRVCELKEFEGVTCPCNKFSRVLRE
jgi:hypothetical protein